MASNIKQWIFKLKYVVALVVFVASIGFIGEDCMVNRVEKQQEIARLKGEIAEYERKFDDDKARLISLKTNPEAVKEVARERYYMKTDNEDIFIIEDEEE